MKKTTNSNPLKYFNDAAASRKKSVNAGNDKLVKAQVGIQSSDKKKIASDEKRVDIYKSKYIVPSSVNELDSIKKNAIDKGYTKNDNKRYTEFNYTKDPKDTLDYNFMGKPEGGKGYFKTVPKFYVKTEKNKEKIVRSEKKQGGAVNSKKK